MRDPISPLSGRRGTVQDDWRARLPEEKLIVFTAYVRRLDSTYDMLSVSLDEALALRQEGRLMTVLPGGERNAKPLRAADRAAGIFDSGAERTCQTLRHGTECGSS